jgi:hypothetical protein
VRWISSIVRDLLVVVDGYTLGYSTREDASRWWMAIVKMGNMRNMRDDLREIERK